MAPPDDAEEALRSTNPKANFHRLTRLLMRGGVKLLQETFDSIHSPADLPVKLADPAIQAQLRGARLTQPERNCLYPSTGVYGKSSDFDITLIFKLFRTICNLAPPPGTRGWDDLPNSTDHSLVADLVRIKYYRNEIHGHRHTTEISDIEFVHLWGEIRETLLRIATNISPAKKDEWKKSIDDLCHNPLTPDEERCIEELETWYKQDMDVKNELEKLSGTVEANFSTLREELTRLRSQPSVVVVIQMNVESSTQALPTQAGYHQAAGSEPMFIVPNLPAPEQVVGAESGSPDDPEPINPPDIDVWNVILSFKESVDLFLRYLRCKLQLLVRNDEVGSWHVTVECSSLQILEGLWDDYRSGHLNSVAQEILITPQVLEKLGLTVMKLKTFISEDQYEKGKKLFEASSGVEDRGETQSAFQATISRATSEGSIEPDLLARISILEQENVKLKEKVEAVEGSFQSERDWMSKIEKENYELRRLVAANRMSMRDRDLLARISILEQENVKLKEKVEAVEGSFQSERDWMSKIEKENYELRRLVAANRMSMRDRDLLARISILEQENVKLKEKVEAIEGSFQSEMKISELEDDFSSKWLSREESYAGEYRQLQRRPWTYSSDIERFTGWNYEVRNGFCQVIINQTTHEAIVGEEDEIVSVFQSLGYDVDKATSSANDDVKQLVKPIAARDYDNSDIFVCFILSNLTLPYLEIVSSKGGAFNVIDLMAKFSPRNCLSLSEKPKVFIFLVYQKAAAPGTMYPVAKNVPFPGLCLFVPYRKGYLSTLLTEIKLHASDLDLLSILEKAKQSFYQKNNITIPDPVHNFPGKVFLCRKDEK